MNATISTNDDLASLAEELARLQTLQTAKIFVAVNDFALKRLLQSFVQQRKYRNYQVFEKGASLLQALESTKDKCLVIYDLEMPDKNGLQLLAVARKPGDPMKNVTIIMVAGTLNYQAKEKLSQAGVNALVTKPVGQDALIEALKEVRFPT